MPSVILSEAKDLSTSPGKPSPARTSAVGRHAHPAASIGAEARNPPPAMQAPSTASSPQALRRSGLQAFRAQAPNLYSNSPAIVAVSQEAMAPPNMARSPTLASCGRRSSASAEMPPIWMPIDEKMAKPHSA